MRSPFRSLPLILIAAVTTASCGDGSSNTPWLKAASPPAAAAEDSLYGTPASANIRVLPVEIEVRGLPEGWNGMRIAAISDFQLGLWPDNEKVAAAAVRQAIAANPDVIVLLGDYVMRGDDYAALDRVLAPLRGKTVLAVLGNADKEDEPEGVDSTEIRTVQALSRNGVKVLRNTRARIGRNGDSAYIAGVDPYVARRPEWRQAEIYGTIPGAPSTQVLLSHMPAAAPGLPTGKYPVVLAGHTHCGRIEVPGTPRLSWLNTEVLPNGRMAAIDRAYRIRGSTVFVTCGVGYSFVPVRFSAPPEVALITLRAVAEPVKADTTGPKAPNVDSLITQYQLRRDSAVRRDSARRDTTAATD